MPLSTGKSQKTIGKNVGELMHKYKKSGKIGTSKPASKKKAQKQAVAIALNNAGKSNTQKESISFDDLVNNLLHKHIFSEMGIGYDMSNGERCEDDECKARGPHDHNEDGEVNGRDYLAHRIDKGKENSEDEEMDGEEDCEWAAQGCSCDGCDQCRANRHEHGEAGCGCEEKQPTTVMYVPGLTKF